MNTLLIEWCAYCEGAASFDKSHFLGLLKAHSSTDELRRIFSYFPYVDELIDRAKNVIRSGDLNEGLYLAPRNRVATEQLIVLGGAWLKEQERVCGLLKDQELSEICRNAQVRYVTPEELDFSLQLDIPHFWFFDEVGEVVRKSRVSDSEQIYGIFEALYGLAADYYLAWHIGRPLFGFDVNFEPYFKFWQAGGKCALTNDYFLVSN